jgi:hypothetical protein
VSSSTPNFNTHIPEKIMTPDRVTTRLGELEFFDGMPTDATAATLLDHLTFLRGVEVFLNTVQVASLEAARVGLAEVGATAANKVVIYDDLMDSNSLFLTGNTDTVYAIAFLELDRDGPTVVEIPPGSGPGTVDDAWFRFVVDTGAPGPDRGQGGKYLILPPGHDGEVPGGYFVAQSTSYVNLVLLRGFMVDGSTGPASQMFRNGVKIYPLSRKDDPPPMEFINGSGLVFNTIHANTFEFYEELHGVIDREPVEIIDPETRGLIAAIGIRKGKPFAPDEHTREILTDAVAVGNATARTIFFQTNVPDNFLYEGSYWKRGFFGGDYRFLLDGDEGAGERNLDARTALFYMATLNTPAMTMKMVGAPATTSTEPSPIGSPFHRTYPRRTSGLSSSTTRRRGPSCRQASSIPPRAAKRARSKRMPTARSTSTSAPRRRTDTRRTGPRRCPARAGSLCSDSTAPSSRGST